MSCFKTRGDAGLRLAEPRLDRRWMTTDQSGKKNTSCSIIHDFARLFSNLYLSQAGSGKPQKQIFGKSWEFGPTGLTPPLPVRWDSQKGKKK